jgi:hypothetical protein
MKSLFRIDSTLTSGRNSQYTLLALTAILLAFTSLNCSLVTSVLDPGDRADRNTQPEVERQQDLPDPNRAANPDPVDQPPPDDPGWDYPDSFYLEGIWVSDTDTGYGTIMHTELILEYTGTFSQQVTAGSLMTWDVGTYEVGDGFIRFVVEDHEPKEYLDQTMSWLTGFTYYYEFVDDDTIIFEDHISGNSWYAYRE